MGASKNIETRGHITGFREEIDKMANEDTELFFTWFDAAAGKEESFKKGEADFRQYFLTPISETRLPVKRETTLEIGHGGGRLLASASKYFLRCYGVDIHKQNRVVENELHRRGIHNVTLQHGSGKELSLSDNMFDLVYSFIVLQHVEKIGIFINYLQETYRVLKPGGVAILYFGRYAPLSRNRSTSLLRHLDLILERILLPKGYRELPARVNCTNLIIRLDHAKRLARKAGLTVRKSLLSYKNITRRTYGGQHGLLLQKPL